jgi:hypothetical protein
MKVIVLAFFAVTIYVTNLSGQEKDSISSVDYYHEKVMDIDNHLDSWHNDENGPFEFILNLSANWWKNSPDVNGWPIWCTAALLDKQYIQGAGAIPGSACSFAIMACLRYYVYTGDTSFLNMAKRTGDYIIKQDLTPSEFTKYPNFPYAVGTTGNINPQGTGHPNEIDTINPIFSVQPDKGAMLGTALLELYKVTGNPDYLNTSVNIANCLSENAIAGTDTLSPWPMRVMADDGSTVDGQFSANTSYSCRLFDELLRIGQPGNGKYKATRDAVWSWLNDQVIAYDDGSKWYNFFEEVGGDENNSTQINALETVRYLIDKKSQADSDWFNLSERIINQVTRRWSVSSLEKDGYVSIGEQDVDMSPYNSHTARYGSILAMYYEAGANIAFRDTAYHSLCYGLYSVENDGFTNTYFRDGGYAWTTDSFGDFLFHYMEAIAAIPEWAGSRNHVLKSTSTITKVSYIDTAQVVYSAFDASGSDKLKLTKEPVSVKVNGSNIKSYTWDNTSKVLIINRLSGKNVEVNLTDTIIESSIPILSTTAVFSITSSTAISGGYITSDGGAAVTARGVCWSTMQNPTLNDNKTNDGSGSGSFVSFITGLADGTTYHTRSYATNSIGTGYGEDISFMSLVTDISENTNPEILIYPNPTNGNFWVELDQRFSEGNKFEVCDYYGRILFQKDLEVGIRQCFDLTFLHKGLYFIRIQNKNKSYFQKVVIQ